ncbi:nuclear transcription factor Y subunit C-1-like isoform X2 [Solanum dulcamara]|uniref:nuclear transcription factor Y subunit C-1-like isoform X2 n=1 Tax=Solanum dulcamara TaxID=45834 RepID=UPI0024851D88|nr:nuclear transcription factor Y subunit C-1-like isoform X2 [Solanum dulcamara]
MAKIFCYIEKSAPPPKPMENNSHQSVEAQYAGNPYHHFFQQQQQQQQEQMQMFWNHQLQEIKELNDFKHHQFPISRLKRIIKSDKNVLKISTETPILFSKACELFILELTLRSWFHAQENKRRTLKKNDFTAAIRQTEIFDFLVDVVPRDEINEQANGFGPGMVGSSVSAVPNYYPLMGQPAMPGVMIGRPAVPVVAPSVYVQPSLQAWQAPEDNSYAGGWNSGLGNLDRQS